MRFKSRIENICIGLGLTVKVIYISTNTSDQWVLMQPFLRRLEENPFLLVSFFIWASETDRRVIRSFLVEI